MDPTLLGDILFHVVAGYIIIGLVVCLVELVMDGEFEKMFIPQFGRDHLVLAYVLFCLTAVFAWFFVVLYELFTEDKR